MLGAKVICLPRSATRSFSSLLRATERFTAGVVASTPRTPVPAVASSSVNASGIRINTLDNGSPCVTLSFSMLGSGSRSEAAHEAGFAQLLASSAFNGSNTQTGLRMIRSFDDLGAKVYAFANRDAVTYHVTCTSEAVDRVTALVADAVCNPVSAEKFYYIGDGRNTALAPKQKKFASCGLSQLDDALHEAAFGAFAPLGNPAHSGNALTASVDKVMAFRARTFSPSNLVVSATGISQDALKTAVDTHFKFGAGSKNALPATPLPPSPFIGGDVKIRTGSDKSYAGIAFPVPAGAGANAYILLASALKANTPKGCKVFHHQYADGGLLGFKVSGNSASDAAAKLGAAISSLKAVAAEGVSDAFVKNAVLGESAHSALVKKSLTGVTATAATPAQAAAAAKAALACARPAYAVYGSTHGSASYDAVKAMLK